MITSLSNISEHVVDVNDFLLRSRILKLFNEVQAQVFGQVVKNTVSDHDAAKSPLIVEAFIVDLT